MSESQASNLLHRLGLWARRSVVLDQQGRIISGAIDPEAEILYMQLFELHDHLLEGRYLGSNEQKFLQYCSSFIQPYMREIRELERQFA